MKKIMFSLIVGMMVSISSLTSSYADEEIIESYECYYCNDYASGPDLKVFINKGYKTGFIEFNGIKHNTDFEFSGFDRRWNFNNASLFISPIKDGVIGSYYNFSGIPKGTSTKPSSILFCKKSK